MVVFEGKSAIVTGASRGIGRATARRLASAGCAVFLAADGPAEDLEAAAAECRKAGKVRAEWGLFDLAELGESEAMVKAALECFRKVDILVNNAGVRADKLLGEFTHKDFDYVVGVNLRAPFFASQAVLPSMRAAGGGCIIHIASQLGVVAAKKTAIYGMTKAALIHLTKVMALELAPAGIRVNAISPGPIATEFLLERLNKDPEERAQRLKYVPAGRFGEAEEIAAAVVFLASGEATFVHGQNLLVDGGYVTH